MIKDGHMKFADIITALKPDTQYVNSIGGLPATEEDFNKIQWIVGEENGQAILSTTNPHSEITWEKFKTERDEIQAEYDAQDYARKRKAEYPSIQDLVVALYDTDDKAAIDAKRAEIKLKYPKP